MRLVGADDHLYSNSMDVIQWLADSDLLEMIVDKLDTAVSLKKWHLGYTSNPFFGVGNEPNLDCQSILVFVGSYLSSFCCQLYQGGYICPLSLVV